MMSPIERRVVLRLSEPTEDTEPCDPACDDMLWGARGYGFVLFPTRARRRGRGATD